MENENEIIKAPDELVKALNAVIRIMGEAIDGTADALMFTCPAAPASPDIYIIWGEREKALFRKLYDLVSLSEEDMEAMKRHAQN